MCTLHTVIWPDITSQLQVTSKDILPNIDRQQAAVSVHVRHPVSSGCDGMVPSAAGCRHLQRSAYATPYNALSMGRKTPCVDLDLWPWHSNSSERGTKHVFPVYLTQIRSAVPETFHTQTKKSQTVPKQNLMQFTACGNNKAVNGTTWDFRNLRHNSAILGWMS